MCKIEDCFLIETGYWIDKSKGIFKRNNFLPANLIRSLVLNRNNYGIFQTAYRYNTENQDQAFLYGDFYLDFDSDVFEDVRKDALKAISYLKIVFNLTVPEEQIRIYFSGNKGVHIVVPAEIIGIQPMKELNDIYKTIACAINQYTDYGTIDLKIYDRKRLFRLPNSVHEKTDLYKVEITLDELRYLSENEIKNIAKSKRYLQHREYRLSREANKMFDIFIERTKVRLNDFKNIKSKGTLKYTPPCIIKILNDGAIEGQRNHTIAILASFFKSSGKDLLETIEIIERWNSEKNSNPTPVSELKKTSRSIYNCEKSFGCSTIKTLNLCVDEECKFKK